MITRKVYSTPRNAYLSCDGKGFNSSLGGFSSEGNTLSSIGGNFSNQGTHPFASITSPCSIIECRNSNSDVFTSSTQLGLTRQDLRGSVTPRPDRVYGMCNCRVAYVYQGLP